MASFLFAELVQIQAKPVLRHFSFCTYNFLSQPLTIPGKPGESCSTVLHLK